MRVHIPFVTVTVIVTEYSKINSASPVGTRPGAKFHKFVADLE
jgi:hypothetical protein